MLFIHLGNSRKLTFLKISLQWTQLNQLHHKLSQSYEVNDDYSQRKLL